MSHPRIQGLGHGRPAEIVHPFGLPQALLCIQEELPTLFDLVINTDVLEPGKAPEVVVVAAT
jgi:hypothetical protein